MSRIHGSLMSVHVGQCGNQLAQSFWKSLCDEHGIDERGQPIHDMDPTDNKEMFFYQADDNHYIPRAILIDLEPRVINGMMQHKDFGHLFNQDNIYLSTHGGGAGNNWASGYHQARNLSTSKMILFSEVYEEIMDKIVREAENEDVMYLSFLSSFDKKVIQTYSVFANQDDGAGDVVVHPYNSILSMQRLIEFPTHTVVLDNSALHRLASGKFRTETPTFDHINSLVARIMSTTTAPYRFNSLMIPSIRHLNIAPFSPLHFLQSGFSPVVDPNTTFTRKTSVADIVRYLLKPSSMMVSTANRAKPDDCVIAAYLMLQGQIDPMDLHRLESSTDGILQSVRRPPFFTTNPLNIFEIPSSPYIKPQYKAGFLNEFLIVSGLILNNSTSIAPLFEMLMGKFDKLRSKKAFLDRFEKEASFDLAMMDEAKMAVEDLVEHYKSIKKMDYITKGI
ncbi:hypothetical protein WR25_08941 [Diploscapter pachys]|uniref:Tubulin/FtsZ GTPase domain-containing protein n=1 Tax=Diploscapter pachys TaxID=2018661 RepID=A0A2A2LS54_9BILA|nr:hypothetical protein WR25_08941 [Diploscapter pachys]